VLQIDAHLDGREERLGVRGGYSSPMFRLREMPWVRFIAQVGLRGTGFSRREEVGIDVCEFYPALDVNDLTALTIARLFTMVIGLTMGPVSTL
jgi:arginase family enzyme